MELFDYLHASDMWCNYRKVSIKKDKEVYKYIRVIFRNSFGKVMHVTLMLAKLEHLALFPVV